MRDRAAQPGPVWWMFPCRTPQRSGRERWVSAPTVESSGSSPAALEPAPCALSAAQYAVQHAIACAPCARAIPYQPPPSSAARAAPSRVQRYARIRPYVQRYVMASDRGCSDGNCKAIRIEARGKLRHRSSDDIRQRIVHSSRFARDRRTTLVRHITRRAFAAVAAMAMIVCVLAVE